MKINYINNKRIDLRKIASQKNKKFKNIYSLKVSLSSIACMNQTKS